MLIQDKKAIWQVIGCLMQNPTLLNDYEYRLESYDFPEMFHSIVFSAIQNLINNGAKEINHLTVDMYLSSYPDFYEIFTKNNGIEYLVEAMDKAQLGNFKYNYDIIKKFSLLRECNDEGIDVGEIYSESIVDIGKRTKQMRQFESYNLLDIINIVNDKMKRLNEKYIIKYENNPQNYYLTLENYVKNRVDLLKYKNIEPHPIGQDVFGKNPEDYADYISNARSNSRKFCKSEVIERVDKLKVIKLTNEELNFAFDLVHVSKWLEGDKTKINNFLDSNKKGYISLSTVLHKIFDDQPCYIWNLSTEEEEALQPMYEYIMNNEHLDKTKSQKESSKELGV